MLTKRKSWILAFAALAIQLGFLAFTSYRLASNEILGTFWSKRKDEAETCQPVKNIYYVKTHKTGSETLVTMFRNFARRHNLITYPTTADPFPGFMNDKAFKIPREHEYVTFNFFGEHARYSREISHKIMPPDTKYIVSIRHPFSQFVSVFKQFRMQVYILRS